MDEGKETVSDSVLAEGQARTWRAHHGVKQMGRGGSPRESEGRGRRWRGRGRRGRVDKDKGDDEARGEGRG